MNRDTKPTGKWTEEIEQLLGMIHKSENANLDEIREIVRELRTTANYIDLTIRHMRKSTRKSESDFRHISDGGM